MLGATATTTMPTQPPVRPMTIHGRRIPNLDVKSYTVHVVKDGFLETTEQKAEVHKGEEFKLEFHLQPMPRVASLAIQGAGSV